MIDHDSRAGQLQAAGIDSDHIFAVVQQMVTAKQGDRSQIS